MSAIHRQDPQLYAAIASETERQRTQLELIASENYVSDAVLEAAGTVLTNKYAEGLPGKRYYGGCECVDIAETLARDRLKQLFLNLCENAIKYTPEGGSIRVGINRDGREAVVTIADTGM